MGRRLAETAQGLRCSERTLRRYINEGLLHGEQHRRHELRLPPGEERYLRSHWEVLSALRSSLRTEQGVRLAVLFGSTAVGEDGVGSDVDLLVEHKTGDPTDLVRLQRRVQRRLGKRVHLVLREDAEAELLLLAEILREGRVIVDRADGWQQLTRRQGAVLRQAFEEETTIRDAARRGVAEARRRIQAG